MGALRTEYDFWMLEPAKSQGRGAQCADYVARQPQTSCYVSDSIASLPQIPIGGEVVAGIRRRTIEIARAIGLAVTCQFEFRTRHADF